MSNGILSVPGVPIPGQPKQTQHVPHSATKSQASVGTTSAPPAQTPVACTHCGDTTGTCNCCPMCGTNCTCGRQQALANPQVQQQIGQMQTQHQAQIQARTNHNAAASKALTAAGILHCSECLQPIALCNCGGPMCNCTGNGTPCAECAAMGCTCSMGGTCSSCVIMYGCPTCGNGLGGNANNTPCTCGQSPLANTCGMCGAAPGTCQCQTAALPQSGCITPPAPQNIPQGTAYPVMGPGQQTPNVSGQQQVPVQQQPKTENFTKVVIYEGPTVGGLWTHAIVKTEWEKDLDANTEILKTAKHINSFTDNATWTELDLKKVSGLDTATELKEWTKKNSNIWTNFDVKDELKLRAGMGPLNKKNTPRWKRTFKFQESFVPFLKTFIADLGSDLEKESDGLGTKSIMIRGISVEFGNLEIAFKTIGHEKDKMTEKYNAAHHAMNKTMAQYLYKYGATKDATH